MMMSTHSSYQFFAFVHLNIPHLQRYGMDGLDIGAERAVIQSVKLGAVTCLGEE